MTDIITPEGLDDLNNYLSGEQAKIDADLMNQLEDQLKVDKRYNNESIQFALQVAEEYLARKKYMGTVKWFEPGGHFSIEKCPKHKLFFDATANYRAVMFRAGNRVGKTIAGGFCASNWTTGLYPSWWDGRRFDRPTKGWVVGKTGQTVRDTIQKELLGNLGAFGTGMIPKDRIGKVTMRPGVPGGVDTIEVLNDWGDPSLIGFKSVDQRVDAFTGVALDWAWEDEEPSLFVDSELFTRLTTTRGVLINTVTPINGMTPYLLSFEKQADMLGGAQRTIALNEEEQAAFNSKPRINAIVQAGWDDAPWLGESETADLLLKTPPHLRESRRTGIPNIGVGSVYPIDLDSLLIENDDFSHKAHFRYLYALDVGWNKTAILWGAHDPDNDILYIYDEYYMGESVPDVHAGAVRARGAWMPGVIDPASRGRSQSDGMQLFKQYLDAGLKLVTANNAVEAGTTAVYHRMVSGRLKILKRCRNLQAELLIYRRDLNGKIVKENDHLCDDLKYLCVELHRARTKPVSNPFGGSSGSKHYF